ncbi:MAG: hypothetical protein DME45_06695 [Verrucomicrobia bacterium]|nr:MAG: hypothetical protein DME45_06695 [Verrucomicrobiota bacterium]
MGSKVSPHETDPPSVLPDHSTDGVLAYWSSHLDGAQSELIMPSDHGLPRNLQGIIKVKRILQLNY